MISHLLSINYVMIRLVILVMMTSTNLYCSTLMAIKTLSVHRSHPDMQHSELNRVVDVLSLIQICNMRESVTIFRGRPRS